MPKFKALLPLVELASLIEEATLDCYDEEEAHAGFFATLEDRLECPFEAVVMDETIEVTGLDWSGRREGVKAICKKGLKTHRISLVDLVWGDELPEGYEWVEAYRLWLSGQ